MKATLPRSEALKSKKAKAEPRPSGILLKSKKASDLPAEPRPSASETKTKAGARASVTAASRAVPPKPSASAQASVEAGRGAVPSRARAPKAAAAPRSQTTPAKKSEGRGRLAAARASSTPDAAASAPTPAAEPAPTKKPVRKSIKEAAGVSTDAVARRTGKTWDDWFEVLDSAGAATLDQRGIIAILAQKHGIGPWWQQMIAVGYESLRAKSDKPPAADGFHVSHSCTLSAPVARVFKLWNDATERARWLADERFVVKSATPGKVLRARWGKGSSQVAVTFVEKAGKTEVAVEHQQIESRAAADQMKTYWQKKLGLLDDVLADRK